MSAEHAQLLMLLAPVPPKRRPGLPSMVTNAAKGPLSLSRAKEKTNEYLHQPHPLQQHLYSTQPPRLQPTTYLTKPSNTRHSPRRDSLTRYPVQMLERPMDIVERELGTLSCTQFKDSLQSWPTTSGDKYVQLPSVQMPSVIVPPKKPLQNMVLQDLRANDSAPMDITITYSRQTPLLPLPTRPHALTNLSVLAGTATPTIIDSTHIPSLLETPSTRQMKRPEGSCWPHPSLPHIKEPKLKPLLNSSTILKGQGLAIAHKCPHKQKLEPIEN